MNDRINQHVLMDNTPNRFGSGNEVKRLEDDALLTGKGQFTDDVALDLQLRLYFVRSPYPHANIVSIDCTAAKSMPGVVAIYTGADLVSAGVKPIAPPVNFVRADSTPAASAPRRALAFERVRFGGEAVAMVVAQTLDQARDAAEAIIVDYQALPAVVNIEDATTEGATPLTERAPDNIAAQMHHGDPKQCDAVFSQAAHVVSLTIHNQRLAAVSIEPRSVLAWISNDDRLTIRMSTQMPSGVKNALCNDILGIAPDKVRVLVGDVGGGFGMKTGIYPEDAAVAFCAHSLKKPVKWIADRSEEFLSSVHGRDLSTQAQLALNAQGKILGLRVYSSGNIGAYAVPTAVAITLMIGPWVQTSVYDIQTIDFRFKAVLTNTAPTSAYRGAGRPEAIFIIERLMDEAAKQLGIDRIALRRLNFIQPEQMPYKNPMNQVYDTGRFEYIMDKALVLANWSTYAQRAAQSQARGLLRGLGIASFLEWTGGNVLEERVTLAIKTDEKGQGIIEVFAAVNAMGQGIATTLAQLVVDVFGVSIDQVKVILGDTDRGAGFGSAGSRSIFTGGSAMQAGAQQTVEQARTLASTSLEAAAHDIDYHQGRFTIKGTDRSIGLFELAAKSPEGQIFVESSTKVAGPSWPNACHICEIEIDPTTGELAVVAYHSVNDIGKVVNPMIARGQLDGGVIQGLGQALHEGIVYDKQTAQLLTGSLMDYSAPRADAMACTMVNEMDQTIPCKNNPIGVKGVGELGTIGATPALVNAISNALSGYKGKDTKTLQMPLTSSAIWEWINGN
jgi:aerobic carbon-monoxide dehydrogenase large subunit